MHRSWRGSNPHELSGITHARVHATTRAYTQRPLNAAATLRRLWMRRQTPEVSARTHAHTPTRTHTHTHKHTHIHTHTHRLLRMCTRRPWTRRAGSRTGWWGESEKEKGSRMGRGERRRIILACTRLKAHDQRNRLLNVRGRARVIASIQLSFVVTVMVIHGAKRLGSRYDAAIEYKTQRSGCQRQ